jgi:hypothetical protein
VYTIVGSCRFRASIITIGKKMFSCFLSKFDFSDWDRVVSLHDWIDRCYCRENWIDDFGLLLHDLELDWLRDERTESEEESKESEEEENDQEDHHDDLKDEEGGEPVAIAVAPGLDFGILEPVGVSQDWIISKVIIIASAVAGALVGHALGGVEQTVGAGEGEAGCGVSGCGEVQVAGCVEGIEDVEDGDELEDEDHSVEEEDAGSSGQEGEDADKDDPESILPHGREVKGDGEDGGADCGEDDGDLESTVGSGGCFVGKDDGDGEGQEGQNHQKQWEDEDEDCTGGVQLFDG